MPLCYFPFIFLLINWFLKNNKIDQQRDKEQRERRKRRKSDIYCSFHKLKKLNYTKQTTIIWGKPKLVEVNFQVDYMYIIFQTHIFILKYLNFKQMHPSEKIEWKKTFYIKSRKKVVPLQQRRRDEYMYDLTLHCIAQCTYQKQMQ